MNRRQLKKYWKIESYKNFDIHKKSIIEMGLVYKRPKTDRQVKKLDKLINAELSWLRQEVVNKEGLN